jgi:hypothetical protein
MVVAPAMAGRPGSKPLPRTASPPGGDSSGPPVWYRLHLEDME